MDEMWASVWVSVQQGKWIVLSWSTVSFSARSKGGTTGGGLLRGAHPVVVLFLPRFQHQNVRRVQRKDSEPSSLARKGKFIKGKREGDWPLRTSTLPFCWGLSYIPSMKNSLKGWSRSQRSGIWWSHSFETIGTSEKISCHLGNLVSLTDHCDFILCL